MGDILKLEIRKRFCPLAMMAMTGQAIHTLDCGEDDCEIWVNGKCSIVIMAESQRKIANSIYLLERKIDALIKPLSKEHQSGISSRDS